MSEKDKPSCALSLNARRPTTWQFITDKPHSHFDIGYLFISSSFPPHPRPQITVLVTLHQPLVIVCFSLVLDREYFEECPFCSLYLSQKSAHLGCEREREKKGGGGLCVLNSSEAVGLYQLWLICGGLSQAFLHRVSLDLMLCHHECSPGVQTLC